MDSSHGKALPILLTCLLMNTVCWSYDLGTAICPKPPASLFENRRHSLPISNETRTEYYLNKKEMLLPIGLCRSSASCTFHGDHGNTKIEKSDDRSHTYLLRCTEVVDDYPELIQRRTQLTRNIFWEYSSQDAPQYPKRKSTHKDQEDQYTDPDATSTLILTANAEALTEFWDFPHQCSLQGNIATTTQTNLPNSSIESSIGDQTFHTEGTGTSGTITCNQSWKSNSNHFSQTSPRIPAGAAHFKSVQPPEEPLDSLFKIHYSKTPPKPEAIAKNATLAAPAIQAILAGHPPERNFSLDRVSFDIKDPKRLLTSQLQQFNLTQVAHLTLADLKNDNGNVSGLQQLNTKIMHGTICLPHNKTHSHLQYPPPPSNLHTLSDTLYPRATQKLNGPPQEPTLKFNYPTNSKTASTKNVPTRTHKRDATFDPSDGTITHTLTADTLQIPFQEGLLADEHSWSPANDTYELKIIGVCIHGNGKYATAETAKETVMDLLKHQLPTLDVAESKAFAKQRPRHLPELQLTLLIRRATSLYDIITKTFEPGGLQKAAKLCQNPTSINYPLNPQIVTIYTPCSKPSLQPPITRNRKPIPTHYTNIRGDKYPYHQDLRKYCCTPHLTPVHINISNSRGVITPHPNLPSPHAAQMTEALQNNAGFLDDLPIVTKDSQTPGNGQPCIRFPIAPLRPKERKGYTVEAYAICQDVEMNGLPMSAERQASKTDVLDMATQFTALYVQKPTKDGYIPPETRLFEIRQVISDALPPENPLISPHKNKHAKPDPQKNLAKAHLWLWQKRERGVATGTPTFRSKDQSANIQNPMNRAETTATHYKKRLPPNEIVLNTTTSNPTYGHPGTCSPMKHFHCADTKHLPFSFQVDQRYAGKKVEIELVNMEGVRALQSMSTVELSVNGKFRLTLQFTQVSSEHLGHAIFISDFQLPTNVDAMHSWVLQFLHKILSDATISISGRAGKKLNHTHSTPSHIHTEPSPGTRCHQQRCTGKLFECRHRDLSEGLHTRAVRTAPQQYEHNQWSASARLWPCHIGNEAPGLKSLQETRAPPPLHCG
jgi:hypothetical protein